MEYRTGCFGASCVQSLYFLRPYFSTAIFAPSIYLAAASSRLIPRKNKIINVTLLLGQLNLWYPVCHWGKVENDIHMDSLYVIFQKNLR